MLVIATNNNDKLKGKNGMKIIICFPYYWVVVDVYSVRKMGATKTITANLERLPEKTSSDFEGS
jgi:hypothetical protein